MSMIHVFQNLRRLVAEMSETPPTDRELLHRFVHAEDDDAFADVVRRHAGSVLGVCRRVLGHDQDAEDAFQATFFILARRAGGRHWHESVAGWLVQVALHVSLRMKAQRGRRPQSLPEGVDVESPAAAPVPELRWLLDEEISRLPEKYRAAVVLCHCEGKSRQQAAEELGWKPGAVKIRLERARQLLRDRLLRRGVALGAALAVAAMPTPLSAALIRTTAAAARPFARGLVPPSASTNALILAQGALRTMMLTRIKIAAVLTLTLAAVASGVGWLAFHATAAPAPRPRESTPAPENLLAAADPAKEVKKPGPLRILLVAGGPVRDYQFLRSLLVREVDAKRAELSIYLQSAGPNTVQHVPEERLLDRFPDWLEADETKGPANKFHNLLQYDLIIAFDPDWTKLSADQFKMLEQWVDKHAGGLIFVAGPVNTYQLARRDRAAKLQPLLSLLPVVVDDIRLQMGGARRKPTKLQFPGVAAPFLKLDAERKEPLAGWDAFFKAGGFYSYYPIKRVKAGAAIFASLDDPNARYADQNGRQHDQPFLVEQGFGKGRVIYLSAAETWRLRAHHESFHEQFWLALSRHAASRDPGEARIAEPRTELSPAERRAVESGLAWLARQQHRDGHWDDKDGNSRVALTALAGLAFLMQGSTLAEGADAETLRRTTDYLMDRRQRNGSIGNPNNEDENRQFLIGHAFAMMFLASIQGESEDSDRAKKLNETLTRGVEYIQKMQKEEGGWARSTEPKHVESVFSTLVQLEALRAARGAGIATNGETIVRGQKALERQLRTAGGNRAAALVATFAGSGFDDPLARKWLQAAIQSPALAGDPGFERDWNVLAHARAAYLLGEQGQAKLFPTSKPAERFTWSGYRNRTFPQILKEQNDNGGFGAKESRLTTTAAYLMILQLDQAGLPAFAR